MHPPGSEQRGAVLEASHQLFCACARLTRRFRQMPDAHDRRRRDLLAEHAHPRRAQTGGKMSFRALAQKVLGRKSTKDMGVDRLARKYSERLRKCPSPNQGPEHRTEGLYQEIMHERAHHLRLKDALQEGVQKLAAGAQKKPAKK